MSLELLSQADMVLNACGRPVPPKGFKFVELPRIIPFHLDYAGMVMPCLIAQPLVSPVLVPGAAIVAANGAINELQNVSNDNFNLFNIGGNLYMALAGTGGTGGQLAVYKSTDGGLTWTAQDGTHQPTTVTNGYSITQSGNLLVFACVTAGTDVFVQTFNCTSNLWGTASVNAGLSTVIGVAIVVQASGNTFVYVDHSGSGNTIQFMQLSSLGVWSGPTTVVTAGLAQFATTMMQVKADTTGQMNVFYTLDTGFATPTVFWWIPVSATGVIGAPVAISASIPDPSTNHGGTYPNQLAYNPAIGGGVFVVPIFTDNSSTIPNFVTGSPTIGWTTSSPDPTGATVPAGSTVGAAVAVNSVCGGKAQVIGMWGVYDTSTGLVDQLWSSVWNGTAWAAPIKAYDAVVLPPSGADPVSSNQAIAAFSVIQLASGAMAMGFEAVLTNTFGLRGPGYFTPLTGAVPSATANRPTQNRIENRSNTLYLCMGIMLKTDPVQVRIKWPNGRYWNQTPSGNVIVANSADFPQGTGGNLYALDEEIAIERGGNVAIEVSGSNGGPVDVQLWGKVRYLLKDTAGGAAVDGDTCVIGYPASAKSQGATGCLVGYPVKAGASAIKMISDPVEVLKARPRFSCWPNGNIFAPEFRLGNQCETDTPPGARDEAFTFFSGVTGTNIPTPYAIPGGGQLYSQAIALPGQDDIVIRRFRAIVTWLGGATGTPVVQLRLPNGYSVTGGDLIPVNLGYWMPVFPTLRIAAGTVLIVDLADSLQVDPGTINVVLEFDAVKRRKVPA